MNDAPNGHHTPLFKRLMQLLRGENASSAAMRESLEEVIEESERKEPALSQQERVMLANLLAFGELKVSDVMVPRAEIVAVDEDTPLARTDEPVPRGQAFAPAGLSRDARRSHRPGACEGRAGALLEPNGANDYRLDFGKDRAHPAADAVRAAFDARAGSLLKMQASHTHLALVIDEYGGTDGLVSIEDIIEEIVGDIADEHDEEAPALKRDDDGFVADARVDLEDFKAETGVDLATSEADEDVDSLGGLVASLLGRVPQRGEIIAHPSGYEFEVLEADPRRIKRLRIRRGEAHPPA